MVVNFSPKKILRFSVLTASTALVALTGCRETEQNRPLSYEPGVYGGAPDQSLGEQRNEQLRQRGLQQRFY